jgi:hypothetical protein
MNPREMLTGIESSSGADQPALFKYGKESTRSIMRIASARDVALKELVKFKSTLPNTFRFLCH